MITPVKLGMATAAGLLLAISSSISHDLLKGILMPNITEKTELLASRLAIAGMLVGLSSTLIYIFWFKGWFFVKGTAMAPDDAPPPDSIQNLVENIRVPMGSGDATGH